MRRVVGLLFCSGCYVGGGLTKYNNDPNVTFTAPDDGDRVVAGAPVTFSASVTDAQQPTSELDYFWSVSPSGELDASTMLVTDRTVSLEVRDGFAAGTWTVKLQVIDADGASDEDELTISSVEYFPPTVQILSPVDGAVLAQGQPVDVQAVFSDPDQNDLSQLQLSWGGVAATEASAPSHPDANGNVQFTLPAPNIGNQTLSVEALDSDGGSGNASSKFTVIDADQDRDGYIDIQYGGDDCNDGNDAIHPDADDICDGLDDDCDGLTDEEPLIWLQDADGDGFGNDTNTVESCEAPESYVATGGDCDDTAATIYPGADEFCNGLDDDCDGSVDDNAVDGVLSYADQDTDGYGDPSTVFLGCDVPTGYVRIDQDCDDTAAQVNPKVAEACNGYDDNCDGQVDDATAIDPSVWHADADGDRYGDPGVVIIACNAPAGYLADASDCNDTLASVYPGSFETCDGIDDDCDGTIDESDAVDALVWYVDSDGDGEGDPAITTRSCGQPTGYVASNLDCDDGDASVYPGATEYCNGVDDDCDGSTDESSAADADTWYADLDGDNYGDPGNTSRSCNRPVGTVADNNDCDDHDGAVYPGAPEFCNGQDDDCDGTVDENDAADASTWYLDADQDSYGDANRAQNACSQPSGMVANANDCDDSDKAVLPGGNEICNGVDDDCDGLTDDADSSLDLSTATTWYADADGDNYGDPAVTSVTCIADSGYLADATDCDDGTASAHPGLKEICNDGLDNDCDGTANGCTWSGAISVGTANVHFYGATGDLLASSVAYGSDADGDGLSDVVLTATGADANGTNSGAVYVYSDPPNGTFATSAASIVITGAAGDGLGVHAEGGGDLNGDHIDDLLVGNPNSTTMGSSIGEGWALFGPLSSGTLANQTGTHFTGSTTNLLFGTSMANGDVSGDGYDDVVVGAPGVGVSYISYVYIYQGPFTATTLSTTAKSSSISASYKGTAFGTDVELADFNGDGYADILVSGPNENHWNNNGGVVDVFYGPLVGARAQGNADVYVSGTVHAGDTIDSPGDVDNDGYADLLIGQTAYANFGGGAWLVTGGTSQPSGVVTTVATASYRPTKSAQYWQAPTTGFLDANGSVDLVIGAYSDDTTAADAGAAYVFFDFGMGVGSFTEADADVWFTGRYAGDKTGMELCASGDADGDGQDDLLLAAPYEDSGGTSSGSVYLLRGPNL